MRNSIENTLVEDEAKLNATKQKKLKKKVKRDKSMNSDLELSHRGTDSDHNASLNLAGITSSTSFSAFPEKDTDNSEIQTPVITKTKINDNMSAEKDTFNFNPTGKSKNKRERVVVHVRLRPFNRSESEKGSKSSISNFDPETNLISIHKDKSEGIKSKFYFDSLFPDDVTQEQVYEIAGKRVVNSVLKGFNGTIFAYGQTGTGKTFTMLGDYLSKDLEGLNMGIIPRSLKQIFEECNQQSSEFNYEISVSFIQIYMEMIQDLLEPANTEIRIREDLVNGVYVSGVLWVPVKNLQQSMKVFSLGEKNRATSFTKLNAHSSRSHAVFIVKLEKRKKLTEKQMEKWRGETFEYMTSSTLFLVDLAGSERVKKSKATDVRLDEAKMINFSLSALGNCIHALTEKNTTHVPFRDSKLTRLLQDSLGGNSKTSMIVTIGPSYTSRSETIMSLKFGSRAMKVENKPTVNKKIDYKMLAMQLQEEIDAKTDQIASLEIQIQNSISKWPRWGNSPDNLQKESDVNEIETDSSDQLKYKELYLK